MLQFPRSCSAHLCWKWKESERKILADFLLSLIKQHRQLWFNTTCFLGRDPGDPDLLLGCFQVVFSSFLFVCLQKIDEPRRVKDWGCKSMLSFQTFWLHLHFVQILTSKLCSATCDLPAWIRWWKQVSSLFLQPWKHWATQECRT